MACLNKGGFIMRYHLTGVDEGKREIYMIADDESCNITISAADEAWSGKASDIEVINAPDGATVFYLDGEGNQTYKNYRFGPEGATIV